MRRDGLRIESPAHPFHLQSVNATENPSDIGSAALIVFAVKLWDTEAAACSLGPIIVADAANGDLVMAEFFAACARHGARRETDRRHRYCHLGEVHRVDGALGFDFVATREHEPDIGACGNAAIATSTDA